MNCEPCLPPSFKANASIPVDEITVTAIDGYPVEIPVRVMLRLEPRPLLVLEYDAFPPALLDPSAKRRTLSLDNGGEVEVVNPTPLPGPAGLRGTLYPARQPFTLLDNGRPLRLVSFGVVNFPDLHGKHDEWVEAGGTMVDCGTAKLPAPPFQVTIGANPDLNENKRILAETRGYAVTHTGRLERTDGGAFSTFDAGQVLSAVRSFLSFARGASCGLVNATGADANGEVSWVRWGAQGVAGWDTVRSWCWNLTDGADVLADAFPGFWTQCQADAANSDQTIELAIHWYVCSNEADAVAPSLVLSQAALERLTFKQLGAKPCKGETRKTGVWIGRALGNAGIGLSIPTECQHLAAAGQQHGWTTGPHAIVAARKRPHPSEDDEPADNRDTTRGSEPQSVVRRTPTAAPIRLCRLVQEPNNKRVGAGPLGSFAVAEAPTMATVAPTRRFRGRPDFRCRLPPTHSCRPRRGHESGTVQTPPRPADGR